MFLSKYIIYHWIEDSNDKHLPVSPRMKCSFYIYYFFVYLMFSLTWHRSQVSATSPNSWLNVWTQKFLIPLMELILSDPKCTKGNVLSVAFTISQRPDVRITLLLLEAPPNDKKFVRDASLSKKKIITPTTTSARSNRGDNDSSSS